MKRQKDNVVRVVVWTFRFLFLAAILVVFSVGSAESARLFYQTSPFLFLAALTGNALHFDGFWSGVALGVGAAIFVASFFKRRLFCHYFCPLGTAVDAAAVARRNFFKKYCKNRWLKNGYVVRTRFPFYIAAFFWALLTLGAIFGDAFENPRFNLSAFAFDPLALLSRWTLERPIFGVATFVFVASFVVSPYFWRFNVCPCGAFQDVAFFAVRSLVVQPIQRLAGRLAGVSPNERLKSDVEKPVFSSPPRRSFLTTLAFGGFGLFCVAAGFAESALETFRNGVKSARKIFIRPPGALPDDDFLTRCARCGRCVAVCPTRILRPVGRNFADVARFQDVSNGDANAEPNIEPSVKSFARFMKTEESIRVRAQFDAPEVVFESGGFCEKDCVACSNACPTGALTPLRIADKKRVKIARIHFEVEHCLIYYQQECSICRRECPFEAIDFVWSDEEYASFPVVDAEKCVGCGRCVAFCPGEPIFSELSDDGTRSTESEKPRIKALSLSPLDASDVAG